MKKILAVGALLFAFTNVFAYNPPVNGEKIYELTNPTFLGGGSSAVGGPFNEVVPESITFNPALVASEQRTTVNVSAGFLIDSKSEDGCSNFGWGLQAGSIQPNKFFVLSIAAEALFIDNPALDVKNHLSARVGLSKEINDNISIGLDGYFGYFFSDNPDFIVGADLGVLFSFEKLGFFKEPKIGVSLLNMGKKLNDIGVVGLDGTNDGTAFPSTFTPRLGFSSQLFTLGNFVNRFKGAFSLDAYFPTFQNAIVDAALGFSFKDMINLTVGWEANIREIISTKKVALPSVGLSVHLVLSNGDSKDTWEQNEFIPALAWQNLGGIHDISAGVTMYFGMTDDEPPVITLWDEELEY